MSAMLDLLSYEDSGSQKSMTLVGNLVLCESKSVYHQHLHHMPDYLEWLLKMMYSLGGKTLEEYVQWEILLWEFILLGIVFLYSIFLPVNLNPFLLYGFCWLPSVWLIYAASAQILLQIY
ncbi:hypothetical protein DSO57_1020043 [Entomophthora muscae]|uniref:Uncharacterized protein n=1 Tax=Entomophthora muscae TaxID=34485 RepID=A0ACC2S5P4_9FUNG|nr:hypothetical protein DSO57_1020043 [Entomophthora muscae]